MENNYNEEITEFLKNVSSDNDLQNKLKDDNQEDE